MVRVYIPTLFILIIGCSNAYALTIKNVSHSHKYIDFNKDKNLIIRYTLDQTARVSLNIYDDRDLLIRHIKSEGSVSKGGHSFIWNGRDQVNRAVPPEAYRYTLVASNGSNTVEHDLSDLTGGHRIEVKNVRWSKKTKTVQYSLTKPARVNIRIGLKNNGPLLATITDWVARDYGQYTIDWNGYDNSGVVDISKMEDYDLYAQAFTLSENTILVGPYSNQISLINTTWDTEKRVRKKKTKKQMKAHSQQYIENRGDFTLKVALPNSLKKTNTGIPIVTEKVPVRFNVSSEVQLRMLNDRFEPILYVDGKFVTENEVGFFPMTWNWDPSGMKEGEHVLTVNLRGYDGHYGAASVMVYVKH